MESWVSVDKVSEISPGRSQLPPRRPRENPEFKLRNGEKGVLLSALSEKVVGLKKT